MTLKEQLIREIDKMPPEDLVLVQHLIQTLGRKVRVRAKKSNGYLEVRKALAPCTGNLSEEISTDREDRI